MYLDNDRTVDLEFSWSFTLRVLWLAMNRSRLTCLIICGIYDESTQGIQLGFLHFVHSGVSLSPISIVLSYSRVVLNRQWKLVWRILEVPSDCELHNNISQCHKQHQKTTINLISLQLRCVLIRETYSLPKLCSPSVLWIKARRNQMLLFWGSSSSACW